MSVDTGDGNVARVVVPGGPRERPRLDAERNGAFGAEPQSYQGRPAVVPPTSNVGALGHWVRRWGFGVELALCVLVIGVVLLQWSEGRIAAAAVMVTWVVANFHQGPTLAGSVDRQLRKVVRAALPSLALLAVVGALAAHSPAVERHVIAAIAASSCVSMGCRLARWRLSSPTRVVAIGDRVDIAQVVSSWRDSARVQVVGALLHEPGLSDSQIPTEILDVPVVSGLHAADTWVESWSADLVVVSLGPGFTGEDFRRLSWHLESSQVSLAVLEVLDGVSPGRVEPGRLDGISLMDVRAPHPSRWTRGVKQVVDQLGAAVAIVLLARLMLLIAAAVSLTSRGPATFRQVRVGQFGREFRVVKFRTMVCDAEAQRDQLEGSNQCVDSVLFKMKDDPRITAVGRFLRRSSLDELPQLFNVLRGDMSLVGPRPHLPCEVARMEGNALRPLAVRPGMTGLWQVSGRSDLAYDKAVELDAFYADNWSLTGDALIAFRTIKAVISGKGAY